MQVSSWRGVCVLVKRVRCFDDHGDKALLFWGRLLQGRGVESCEGDNQGLQQGVRVRSDGRCRKLMYLVSNRGTAWRGRRIRRR